MTSRPPVGIGLPTYNGQRYIAQALVSLLAQDHGDLEIVVADNASSDRTPEIVRDFMRRDSRIRHDRVEKHLSAARNFNRAFASANGPYFMWAADDDLWDAAYVRRCAAALDDDQATVMASTGIRFIDPTDQVLEGDFGQYDNPDLSSRSVVERARTLLRRRGWYQIYGLARRDALERTRLFQDTYGADVVLMLELAMLGPVLRIPEALFSYRRFPDRTEADRAKRQGGIPAEAEVMTARMTHLQEALSDAVWSSRLSRPMKLRLLGEILRAAYVDDTPIRSKARLEAPGRAKAAARERDLRRFVKFSLAHGIGELERIPGVGRRWVLRFRRLPARARRKLGA